MVYIVVQGCYSDWCIIGYFTNREEAEKYCLKYSNHDYYIQDIKCIDGKEDVSYIKVLYKRPIHFYYVNGSWSCISSDDNDDLEIYQANFKKSNSIIINHHFDSEYITCYINTDVNNFKLSKKIAEDILYQYLDTCDGKPNEKTAEDFNKILSADEDARILAEKENRIRQEELKELKRLKEKYEEVSNV